MTTVGHTSSSCVQRETWYCYAEFSNGDNSNCSTSHEGDYGPHSMTRYGVNMSQHWDYCTLCSYTTNHANHTVPSWTKTHVGEGRWKIAGTCNVCGKDLTHYHDVDGTEPCPYCDEEVSHDWQLISSTYGANCQTVGIDTYECSYCGATMNYPNSKYGSHPMTYYNGKNTSQHWDTCNLCDYTSNYEYHQCSPWYYEKISDGYYRIYGTCEICQGSAEHYHNIYSNEDWPYCDVVICE